MEKISPLHIIGCGDIGRRVALRYLQQGVPANHLSATVRSNNSASLALAMGLIVNKTDLDQPCEKPNPSSTMPTRQEQQTAASGLFYFAPPPPEGERDWRLRAFLKQLNPALVRKFVLISTTGVYGDCEGAWVDEAAPLQPQAARAIRRVDAERALQSWSQQHQITHVILRVPGIYAADRLPLKRLRSGEPVVQTNEAPWTNRIHADDLAAACQLAMEGDCHDEIINVCDDQPSTMTDYFNAVAQHTGLGPPPQISMQEAMQTLSPGMRSYLQESRRIRNKKMKEALGLQLQFPTLHSGGLAYSSLLP